MTELDLNLENKRLNELSAQEITQWAISQSPASAVVSTNFGPHEAVILHLSVQVKPDIPILWADSGYNTRRTYRFAQKLKEILNLNLHVFVPRTTSAFRDAVYGGIPPLGKHEDHKSFTEEVKLEPFRRALQQFNPRVWLTAIRKEQTEFRQSLDILSKTQNGILKVSPVFYWSESDLEDYLNKNNLPVERNYFDPTKVDDQRECGMHPGI